MMGLDETKEIIGQVIGGLVAAGMDDEEEIFELASKLLNHHRPEVVTALGQHLMAGEIEAIISELTLG